MDKCGLVMVLVLIVLVVLMALMVMVPLEVMAADEGECHCDCPASIRAAQCCITQLGCRGAATHMFTHLGNCVCAHCVIFWTHL